MSITIFTFGGLHRETKVAGLLKKAEFKFWGCWWESIHSGLILSRIGLWFCKIYAIAFGLPVCFVSQDMKCDSQSTFLNQISNLIQVRKQRCIANVLDNHFIVTLNLSCNRCPRSLSVYFIVLKSNLYLAVFQVVHKGSINSDNAISILETC